MSEKTKAIQIEGVHLTTEALDALRHLQDDDNYTHTLMMETISELMCYIANIDNEFDNNKKIIQLDKIKLLIYLRDNIIDLKKPYIVCICHLI